MRALVRPQQAERVCHYSQDVQNALQKKKCGTARGKLSGDATDLGIRTFGKMNTEDEFNKLIIKMSVVRISCWKMSAKPSWTPKMKKVC